MRLFRKIIGDISRGLYPNISSCGYCGRTWNVCKAHYTRIDESSSCFPLCKDCWSELTVEERMPYYRTLICEWRSYGFADFNGRDWDEIEELLVANVLNGE